VLQINGFDFYFQNSEAIANELQSHYELFVSIYDLLMKLRTCIREFQAALSEFKVRLPSVLRCPHFLYVFHFLITVKKESSNVNVMDGYD
jgi:hypothetical protein